jgi:hypothetical protein
MTSNTRRQALTFSSFMAALKILTQSSRRRAILNLHPGVSAGESRRNSCVLASTTHWQQ